jgi:hypothetical protein
MQRVVILQRRPANAVVARTQRWLSMMSTTMATNSNQVGNIIEMISKQSIKVVDGSKDVGRKAIAAKDLKIGTVINEFYAPVFRHPTMHTVCLTNGIHIAPTFGAECISHACGLDTNVSMVVQPDAKSCKVVITRDTACGEDLVFNYNTTEWTMSCPFQCSCHVCQNEGKSRTVRGFAHLSVEEQDELISANEVSAYIKSLAMKQRKVRALLPSSVQEEKPKSVSLAI